MSINNNKSTPVTLGLVKSDLAEVCDRLRNYHIIRSMLGIPSDVNANPDHELQLLRECIASLKHLVTEISAHGDCQCEGAEADTTEDSPELCEFCIAVALYNRMGSWTSQHDEAFASFMQKLNKTALPGHRLDQLDQEHVLGFPTAILGDDTFQGLTWAVSWRYHRIFRDNLLEYRPRKSAEQDTSFKQIIPYIILVKGDKIFRYQRGKKGGESRLHAKYSIGIGGHINPGDYFYETAIARELREEVGVITDVSPAQAMVNDDSTEVGKCHFGIVHVAEITELGEAEVSVITKGEFVSLEQLNAQPIEEFEIWSQLCLRDLPAIVRGGRDAFPV